MIPGSAARRSKPMNFSSYDLGDGLHVVWDRGASALVAGEEVVLAFSVRDATGAPVTVEPYMGMAAHAIVASRDGSVFAHLHPSGSISMAALQKFTATTPIVDHGGHDVDTRERRGDPVRVSAIRRVPNLGPGQAEGEGDDCCLPGRRCS